MVCSDIRAMEVSEWRFCKCGKSSGRYLEDGDFAEISGKAAPIGIINDSLIQALRNRNAGITDFDKLDIQAFVFSPEYYKIKKV